MPRYAYGALLFRFTSRILTPALVFALAGCAYTGRIANTEITEYQPVSLLPAETSDENQQRAGDNVLFFLSFSGGGTLNGRSGRGG